MHFRESVENAAGNVAHRRGIVGELGICRLERKQLALETVVIGIAYDRPVEIVIFTIRFRYRLPEFGDSLANVSQCSSNA